MRLRICMLLSVLTGLLATLAAADYRTASNVGRSIK